MVTHGTRAVTKRDHDMGKHLEAPTRFRGMNCTGNLMVIAEMMAGAMALELIGQLQLPP